jgi:hypothetical protein
MKLPNDLYYRLLEKTATGYYNQHHKYLDRDESCVCSACENYRLYIEKTKFLKDAKNDNPRIDV